MVGTILQSHHSVLCLMLLVRFLYSSIKRFYKANIYNANIQKNYLFTKNYYSQSP